MTFQDQIKNEILLNLDSISEQFAQDIEEIGEGECSLAIHKNSIKYVINITIMPQQAFWKQIHKFNKED